jgi:hypothetical protein
MKWHPRRKSGWNLPKKTRFLPPAAGGGFRAVTPDEPLYRGALAPIAAVRLEIKERRAKWKLAQNVPREIRARVIAQLRKRGRPRDGRAIDALQWTIQREVTR